MEMKHRIGLAAATAFYLWGALAAGRNFQRLLDGHILDLVPMENPIAFGAALLIAAIPHIPTFIRHYRLNDPNLVYDFAAWLKPGIERAASGTYEALMTLVHSISHAIRHKRSEVPPPIIIEQTVRRTAEMANSPRASSGSSSSSPPQERREPVSRPAPPPPPREAPGVATSPPSGLDAAFDVEMPRSGAKSARDLIRPTQDRRPIGETGFFDTYVRNVGFGTAEANFLGFQFSASREFIRMHRDSFEEAARAARCAYVLSAALDLTPYLKENPNKTPAQAIRAYLESTRPDAIDEGNPGPMAPWKLSTVTSAGFSWRTRTPTALPWRELAAFIATTKGARRSIPTLPESIELDASLPPLAALTRMIEEFDPTPRTAPPPQETETAVSVATPAAPENTPSSPPASPAPVPSDLGAAFDVDLQTQSPVPTVQPPRLRWEDTGFLAPKLAVLEDGTAQVNYLGIAFIAKSEDWARPQLDDFAAEVRTTRCAILLPAWVDITETVNAGGFSPRAALQKYIMNTIPPLLDQAEGPLAAFPLKHLASFGFEWESLAPTTLPIRTLAAFTSISRAARSAVPNLPERIELDGSLLPEAAIRAYLDASIGADAA